MKGKINMIEKLEIPPENLEPRQYAETLRMAINEIIDFINKKEEVTITVTPGEYNIWGNNPEIQKDYISKKDIEKFEEENPDEIISYKDFKKHFNL